MDERAPRGPEGSRPRIFFGWYIVAASAAANAVLSAAYFQGFSVLFLPIEQHFNWSRSTISAAMSLRQLESGIASPVVGFMLDRVSPRRMIFWSGLVTAAGLVALGFTTGIVTFYVAFLVISLGTSGVSHTVTWPVLIARWFRRKRGLAMGLAVLGPIFGSPFVILNTALEERIGWQAVLIGYGILVAIVISALSALARDRPETYGLLPDGDLPEEGSAAAFGRSGKPAPRIETGLTVSEVMRTREFWLLATYMAGMFTVNSSIQAHQVPFFVNDGGFSPANAAATLTLVFLVSGAGRIGGGFLLDKTDFRVVLVGMAVVMGLSLVYLEVFKPATLVGSLPFVVLFGTALGGLIPTRGTLGSLIFGLRSLGPVIGLLQGGAVAAGVVGPIFMGVVFDLEGSYTIAVWVLAGFSFLLVPLPLLMASPAKLRRRSMLPSTA